MRQTAVEKLAHGRRHALARRVRGQAYMYTHHTHMHICINIYTLCVCVCARARVRMYTHTHILPSELRRSLCRSIEAGVALPCSQGNLPRLSRRSVQIRPCGVCVCVCVCVCVHAPLDARPPPNPHTHTPQRHLACPWAVSAAQ